MAKATQTSKTASRSASKAPLKKPSAEKVIVNAKAVSGSSPIKKNTKAKAPAASALTRNAPPRELSGEERERMIQLAAYHIAERDGFQSGKEQEYWLQGEQQISELLGTTSLSNTETH